VQSTPVIPTVDPVDKSMPPMSRTNACPEARKRDHRTVEQKDTNVAVHPKSIGKQAHDQEDHQPDRENPDFLA
jgi:hypothetical protein